MIKAETIRVLMGLDNTDLSKILYNSGYDGLSSYATVLFDGINVDGHFVYRVNDLADAFDSTEPRIDYSVYVSFNHKDNTVEASY